MKVNVKGLVFVGFAAAILSGAAAHAGDNDQNIVTSKAFTDATYQAKIAGGEGYTGKAVIAGSTAGSPTYTEITSTMPNGGLSASSSNLVTEQAVAEALAAAAGGAGSSFEVTSNKLNGTSTSGQKIGDLQAGSGAGQDQTMYPSAAAVKEYVTSTLASGGTNGDGYEQVANKAAAIVTDSSATGYNANSTTEYASTKAVYDYVESKTGANIVANSVTDGDTTHAPSGEAVYEELVLKQPKAPGTGANADMALVGFGDGTWTTLNGTDYVQVAKFNDGTKDVMRVAVDPSKIDNTGTGIYDLTTSNDSGANSLTTAWAVNQAISEAITDADLSGKQDNLGGTITVGNEQVSTAGKVVTATSTAGDVTYTAIDSAVTSGSNNLITSDAVYDAIDAAQTTNGNTYQPKAAAGIKVGNNGAWDTLAQGTYVGLAQANGTVTVDVTATTTGTAVGSAQSGSTSLATDYAVQQYVNTQIQAQAASKIPDQNTGVCTSTQPCALVAGATSFHWITMATGSHGGGVCGDAGTNQTCEGLGTAPTQGA